MQKSPVNQLFDRQWNSGEIVSIACKPSIARGRFCKRDMTHQPHTVLFNKFSQSINRSSWNLSANILNIASDSLLVISKLLTPKICKLSHQEEGSVKWCSSLVLEAQPSSSPNCNYFKILQFSKWWFLFIKMKHSNNVGRRPSNPILFRVWGLRFGRMAKV